MNESDESKWIDGWMVDEKEESEEEGKKKKKEGEETSSASYGKMTATSRWKNHHLLIVLFGMS